MKGAISTTVLFVFTMFLLFLQIVISFMLYEVFLEIKKERECPDIQGDEELEIQRKIFEARKKAFLGAEAE